MYRNQDRHYFNQILIMGEVCSEDGYPIQEAIVVMEEYVYHLNNYGRERSECLVYTQYTLTDCQGEFSFIVYNANHYYRIKAFGSMRKIQNGKECYSDVYL
ncbi:MAG: hypothetical protein AB9856_05880 [Cellulosilyticaceae bacterium]